MSVLKVAMGAKPDPYNFKIVKREIYDNYTIIVANYPGSVTFGGDKLMVLRGKFSEDLDSLDPHFLDEDHAVIARFIPNELGWNMARNIINFLNIYDK